MNLLLGPYSTGQRTANPFMCGMHACQSLLSRRESHDVSQL